MGEWSKIWHSTTVPLAQNNDKIQKNAKAQVANDQHNNIVKILSEQIHQKHKKTLRPFGAKAVRNFFQLPDFFTLIYSYF